MLNATTRTGFGRRDHRRAASELFERSRDRRSRRLAAAPANAHVLLEDHGYGVVGGCDGDEALAGMRQFSPALVVTDASMPKLSGYEVCQELRADPTLARQPYVIMLTAGGENGRP